MAGKVGVPRMRGTDAQGSKALPRGRKWPTVANAAKMISQRRDLG